MLPLQAGGRWIELGCGERPHSECQVHVDIRWFPHVNFLLDLEETPWQITDADFDGLLSIFSFEHVSWRKVPDVLGETARVIKPGGRVVLVLPDTDAQMRHILHNVRKWDSGVSCMLFGDQNYRHHNEHRSAWRPEYAERLLRTAGLTEGFRVGHFGIVNAPATDMVVEVRKPGAGSADIGSVFDAPGWVTQK